MNSRMNSVSMMDESTTLGAGNSGRGSDVDRGAKHQERTMSSQSRSAGTGTSPTIITKLQPNDVLMGRGFNVMLHPGNIRFIEIIRSRCAEYQSITSRKQKHIIAQQIVSTVRSKKGLFLRKIESSSLSAAASSDEAAEKLMERRVTSSAEHNMVSWTLVDESAILLKVKQALRDQSLIMMSKNISSSSKDGGTPQRPNKPAKGPIKKRPAVVAVANVVTSDGSSR
jgi:hypothetical protein